MRSMGSRMRLVFPLAVALAVHDHPAEGRGKDRAIPLVDRAHPAPAPIEKPAPRCRILGRGAEHSYLGKSVVIQDIVAQGGTIHGISCLKDRMIVLGLDRIEDIRIPASELMVRLGSGASAVFGSSRLRIMLGDSLAGGISGWTHSVDTAFILSKEGILHSVPLESGSVIDSRIIPDMSPIVQMAYSDGLLFILHRDRSLMAISPSGWGFYTTTLPEGARGASIRVEEGKLRLDDSFEIRTDGMPGSLRFVGR